MKSFFLFMFLLFFFPFVSAPVNSVPFPVSHSPKSALPFERAVPKLFLQHQTETGVWEIVWRDSFHSPFIDETKWNLIKQAPRFNGELQFYTPSNVMPKNGRLLLTAKRDSARSYTSGMVHTKKTFSFQYGKVDVIAKHPSGAGFFPAIWLLPSSPEHNRLNVPLPEINLMEAVGRDPARIYAVNYWYKDGTRRTFTSYSLPDPSAFHLYSLEWEPAELRWYVDGKLIHRTTKGIPHERMYLIINLAVGGTWPGNPNGQTPFPSSFEIEEVTVFEQQSPPS